MNFLPDNGGKSYNLCHCVTVCYLYPFFLLLLYSHYAHQSGVTLRLLIWTSGAVLPIPIPQLIPTFTTLPVL
jgi:hypothetical protein